MMSHEREICVFYSATDPLGLKMVVDVADMDKFTLSYGISHLEFSLSRSHAHTLTSLYLRMKKIVEDHTYVIRHEPINSARRKVVDLRISLY